MDTTNKTFSSNRFHSRNMDSDMTAFILGISVYELDHYCCDVINHTLFLHQPPLVCLIDQLQSASQPLLKARILLSCATLICTACQDIHDKLQCRQCSMLMLQQYLSASLLHSLTVANNVNSVLALNELPDSITGQDHELVHWSQLFDGALWLRCHTNPEQDCFCVTTVAALQQLVNKYTNCSHCTSFCVGQDSIHLIVT